MRQSRIILAVGLMLLASFAPRAVAQGEPPAKLVENIEVKIANVDVIVTDAGGHRIGGLSKNDFELFENGKPVEITNFYEERGTMAIDPETGKRITTVPAAIERDLRKRRVIIFVDSSSIDPFVRNRVFASLRKFAAEQLRDDDEVMIVSWNHRLKIEAPLSRDRAVLDAAIERMQKELTGAGWMAAERRETERRIRFEVDNRQVLPIVDCYSRAITVATFYGESVRTDTRLMAKALENLMSALAGVDGRKALILVGESMPLSPGAEMIEYANQVFAPFLNTQNLRGAVDQTVRPETDTQTRIIRSANANGVSIYVISSAGSHPEGDTPAERDEPRSNAVDFIAFTNNANSFQALAAATGGLAMVATTNYEGGFDQVVGDLEWYYSLGYRDTGSAGTRDIAVKVRRPGLKARARVNYIAKTDVEEISDLVIGNAFFPTDRNSLDIVLVCGKPAKAGRNKIRVPVEIRIPASKLTLLPQGDELVGGFAVHIGAINENGERSEVTHKTQQVRVPSADAASLAAKHFTYAVDVITRKGENTLSVSVIDEVSNEAAFAKSIVGAR